MRCSRPIRHSEGPSADHQINIAHARENVHEIRRELFAFSEILEVFATSRANSLVVVCVGRPRLGEWLRSLRAVGLRVFTAGTPNG